MISADLFYTRNDQWLRRDAQNSEVFTLGLTRYGADELGELVFAELAEAGAPIALGAPFGVVESVKAVAELSSPIAGRVLESNRAVAQNPELVNESPLERGWIVRMQLGSEWPQNLMNAAQYAAFRGAEAHGEAHRE